MLPVLTYQYKKTRIRYTRHNSADSVPTSNLVCIKEVAIRTTLCIAGIIYYTCNFVTEIQCTYYKPAFNKRFKRTVCQNKSSKIYLLKKIQTVCNAVYFRLCTNLMYIPHQLQPRDSMAPSIRGLPNGIRYKLGRFYTYI